MTEDLPSPLSPPDCDLRGYDYMPLFGHKLFNSSLYTEATDTEFRSALRLWWAAWQQCPAGSLPSSDAALAMLADFGRDQKSWLKVKKMALHGFVLCSDNRLYHRMLCDEAVKAYDMRLKHDTKRDTDRKRLQSWRDARRKLVSDQPETPQETHEETPPETRFVGGRQHNTVQAKPSSAYANDGCGLFRGMEHITPDPETGRPTCGGHYFDVCMDRVKDLARIDDAVWRGDFRPLIKWLAVDGIHPDVIFRAIKRKAAYRNYEVPRSLNWFKDAIDDELGSKPTTKAH